MLQGAETIVEHAVAHIESVVLKFPLAYIVFSQFDVDHPLLVLIDGFLKCLDDLIGHGLKFRRQFLVVVNGFPALRSFLSL